MHPGDITIADYWGIEKAAPEFDDNKGVSLVLVNNEAGERDFEKVKEIIVDSLSCDESQVTMEANLKDDLEADSLDAVELIMQIEEEFEVEIPDEVASNMKTVKDIVDYIEANK